MTYIEFLRVRNAFAFYAGIMGLVILVVVVSIYGAHTDVGRDGVAVTVGRASPPHHHVSVSQLPLIPLSALFGLAGYCAAVFATVLGSTLHQNAESLNLIFTKPLSRTAIALRHMAVDACGIVAAYVFALVVVCVLPLSTLGWLPRVVGDPAAVGFGILGLGIAYMWYALLQALTVRYRGKAGVIVGASWAVFAVLVGAPQFPLGPVFHTIVVALNFLNPIAYLSSVQVGGDMRTSSVLPIGLEARAALAWTVAAVAGALAVFGWQRIEV